MGCKRRSEVGVNHTAAPVSTPWRMRRRISASQHQTALYMLHGGPPVRPGRAAATPGRLAAPVRPYSRSTRTAAVVFLDRDPGHLELPLRCSPGASVVSLGHATTRKFVISGGRCQAGTSQRVLVRCHTILRACDVAVAAVSPRGPGRSDWAASSLSLRGISAGSTANSTLATDGSRDQLQAGIFGLVAPYLASFEVITAEVQPEALSVCRRRCARWRKGRRSAPPHLLSTDHSNARRHLRNLLRCAVCRTVVDLGVV